MGSVAPSWTELLGRMTAVSFTSATGKIEWRNGTDEGQIWEGVNRFWFRRNGQLRVEDELGLVRLRSNGRTLYRDHSGTVQLREGETSWGGDGSPEAMLGGRNAAENLSPPNDFCTPQGPGSAALVDGRPGWKFVLDPPPHKPFALEVTIDDQTAVVLEMRTVGGDYFTTMTDFVVDAEIEDSRFEYDGPVATHQHEKRLHRERMVQMHDEFSWPTPRYWPAGMQMGLIEADLETGAFVGILEDLSGAILARWPEGTDEAQDLTRYRPKFHLHRWTAHGFDWALAVESPFDQEELERIIDSIPNK